MGHLLQIKSGRRYTLLPRTLVGRSLRCDIHLPHPSISGEHAVIWWDSERWWIRDLGSRNGTRVDGGALEVKQPTELSAGQRIEFGAHPLAWSVESAAPATPRAVALVGGAEVEASDGILALPDEVAPEAVVYSDGRGGWILEHGDEVRPVADLADVSLSGVSWRLHLPQSIEPTADVSAAPPRLEDLELQFTVSSDEEHVSLKAMGPAGEIDLGSRSHHYTLLTLARARLSDATLPAPSQGWVYQDDLYTQLRLDRERLNMIVFRARKQLAGAGVQDARDLIERRPDSQQLRIGSARLIVRQA